MTVSVTNSFSTTKNSNHKVSLKQTSGPQKHQAKQHLSNFDEVESIEMQAVQNLPFESAKLKAQHSHWSERSSSGINQMLTSRQHRHDAALQAYLAIRSASLHMFDMLNKMSAMLAPSAADPLKLGFCKLDFILLVCNVSLAQCQIDGLQGKGHLQRHCALHTWLRHTFWMAQEQCRRRAASCCCAACSRLQATAS